ncbi:MAG: hypothetical protein KatS3mg108_0191 [Isosphaeraceae bacterium]|jgi:hypothetical protein|nr:MAG: hypothetical protein KatS3mg108_0191 [Isosphaeraceae bacterium]
MSSVCLAPTTPDDFPALGEFLARGFRVPADHPFAATDVLAWKYGGSPGSPFRSLLARDDRGAIIGHVGYCLTSLGTARGAPTSTIDRQPILHMLDWLAARDHPGVGTELARAAHQAAPLAYGLGGTPASRRAVRRLGYAYRGELTIYRRILRPLAALRAHEPLPRRLARAVRDTARWATLRPARPRQPLEARPTAHFGLEVDELYAAALAPGPLAATQRTASTLNHRLNYPRGGQTGWHLVSPGARDPIGFATLALSDGPRRTGTIVDLVLPGWDADRTYAAIVALTEALRRLGADTARAIASPDPLAPALTAAGYRPAHTIPWYVRDPNQTWPDSTPAWLTFHEADYAVLPP